MWPCAAAMTPTPKTTETCLEAGLSRAVERGSVTVRERVVEVVVCDLLTERRADHRREAEVHAGPHARVLHFLRQVGHCRERPRHVHARPAHEGEVERVRSEEAAEDLGDRRADR